MKKFFVIFLIFVPFFCWGQGQIFTKRVRLQGYETKTTKVVSSGYNLMDEKLREEVASRWHLTSYEFCSEEEYEASKADPGCLFLRYDVRPSVVDSLLKVVSLDLSKGGPDDIEKLEAAIPIVRIPLAYMENGQLPLHNLFVLSAYVDMIQDYLSQASQNAHVAASSFSVLLQKKSSHKTWFFSEMDLSSSVDVPFREKNMKGHALCVVEDEWKTVYEQENPDAIVSVLIAPSRFVPGAICQKLMIGADDHKLYYIGKVRLKDESEMGFQPSEISSIVRKR